MASGIQNINAQKIDIVYTKLGRALKAVNSPDAEITKFALSDDGVDYRLYNENLPEAERDLRITRSSMFDSWTDENSVMKNKLISLIRDTTEQTKLKVTPDLLEFVINPSSNNDIQTREISINSGYAVPNGFRVTLLDDRYVYLQGARRDDRDDRSVRIAEINREIESLQRELQTLLNDRRTADRISNDFTSPTERDGSTLDRLRDPRIGDESTRTDGERLRIQQRIDEITIRIVELTRERNRLENGNDFNQGGNGNRRSQELRIAGSSSVPFITNVRLVYDEGIGTKFDLADEYITKVIVESFDSGETREVEIKLKTAI